MVKSSTSLNSFSSKYRRGVGIVLFNRERKIFVGERFQLQNGTLQMPQGGIDHREIPESAAVRELYEEVGTNKARIVEKSHAWYAYDYPLDSTFDTIRKQYWGQVQIWFLMEFLGRDEDINVVTEYREFANWQWLDAELVLNSVVDFKKGVYVQVIKEFLPIIQRYNFD
jgi:putative (di)nucleoside polyphosphate hydrolase